MINSLVEGGDYQVSLEASPVIQYMDLSDKLKHTLPLPSSSNPIRGQERKTPSAGSSPARPTGFPNVPKEALDFGSGELLSLAQALSRASKVFQVNFNYDKRLSGTALFVKGSWSRDSFEKILAKVYDIAPPKEKPGDYRASESLQSLFSGPLAELLDTELWPSSEEMPTAKELVSGKEWSYGDLQAKHPQWAQYLDRSALGTGTRVSMRLGLQLNIRGSGVIPLANASAKNEVQSLPVITRNEAAYIIVP